MNRRKRYKLLNNIKSFVKDDTNLFLRLFLLFIIFLSLSGLSIFYFIEINSSPNKILYKQIQEESSDLPVEEQLVANSDLPVPKLTDIENALDIKLEQERIKAEQERIMKERQAKIDKLAGYLRKVNSPMAPFAGTIIEEAESCGANYRIIVAIAGNESGYGRVSYKLYNPYGFLNGVQYAGWEASLSDLTCKVAKYTNKYTDIYTLGKVYGAHNPEQWAKNINWHLSQIP